MSLPRIGISAQAIKRVRNHDCWIFRDELLAMEDSAAVGEIVEVIDRQGGFVAYAFYNPRSHIALRVVSTAPNQPVDRALLGERLKQAISRRRAIAHTNAKRLVFSEADRLPGLIVDEYAGHLVVQFRTAGMDRLRPQIVESLRELAHPQSILERSDKEFREEEALTAVQQPLFGSTPERILIEEQGLKFWVDPHRGHKTGFYLDQRTARLRLGDSVRANQRILDVFSYTGAFGITAAARGARVVCVEQQEPFLELAKENASLNGVLDRMEFVAGNAFYWLEAQTRANARFDCVILDPPALAKSKADITPGRQALHHLLVHALGLLDDGGWLATCICTYHLLGLVEEIVRIAAADRGARLQVRDVWPQAVDHPWILQIPATRYLTSWLFERVGPSTDSPTNTAR